MSNETTENFWAVWNSFEWPEPKTVFYRLYYNDDGTPIVYSQEELPHKYIDVDPATFMNANMNVAVINEELIFKQPSVTVNKLQPAERGTTCDVRDVCVVVKEDQPNRRWAIKTNEIN